MDGRSVPFGHTRRSTLAPSFAALLKGFKERWCSTMNVYHAWCDLKPGVSDVEFGEKVAMYMDHLKAQGLIEGWRLTRRKLGFGLPDLGEFHITMEVKDMHQLEAAFEHVGARTEPVEGLHFGLNSLVRNARFALYRDFPDSFRKKGEERF
jgi:hypothetical protein